MSGMSDTGRPVRDRATVAMLDVVLLYAQSCPEPGGNTVSVWSRARDIAERTPASRNRYVDFLRAASITAVILGHWLIAAPWVVDGGLRLDHMLTVQPWTQWLTLLFQVMPVFFLVGGYSNAASWDAAGRNGTPYGAWVAGRARRRSARSSR